MSSGRKVAAGKEGERLLQWASSVTWEGTETGPQEEGVLNVSVLSGISLGWPWKWEAASQFLGNCGSSSADPSPWCLNRHPLSHSHPPHGALSPCPQLTLDTDSFYFHCLAFQKRCQLYMALILSWVEGGFDCSAQKYGQLVIPTVSLLVWGDDRGFLRDPDSSRGLRGCPSELRLGEGCGPAQTSVPLQPQPVPCPGLPAVRSSTRALCPVHSPCLSRLWLNSAFHPTAPFSLKALRRS